MFFSRSIIKLFRKVCFRRSFLCCGVFHLRWYFLILKGKNLFIFMFFFLEDKDNVIRLGLWFFDGYLLFIREIDGTEQSENIVFNHTDFWVRLYNMFFRKWNILGIIIICKSVGDVLEVDETDISG